MTEQLRGDGELEQAGDGVTAATPPGRYGRRALMLGAAAAGAGVAVSLAGGTAPADAKTDGGDPSVVLGGANTESSPTTITNTKSGAFQGSTSASGGHSGVRGTDSSSSGSYGVAGTSDHNIGVLGMSTHGTGVLGQAATSGQSGVAGIDSSKSGGNGVYGRSDHGGVGVFASSSNGTALHVEGKATFSRSGVATVKSGDKTVTIAVAGVSTSSLVLATIQQLQSGTAVAAAVPGAGLITITLTAKTTAATAVGWFVIG